MKKILLFGFLFYASFSFAQVSPTLAVGLETLTMNKGTIDVKVLTEIIMEKQKELKHEALRRFMYKLFPEANYTTKFYVQNCLNTLLYEKNPQVIEKEILELTTNYALALGVTYAIMQSDNDVDIRTCFTNLSKEYKTYNDSLYYTGGVPIKKSYASYNFKNSIESLQKKIDDTKKEIVPLISKIKTNTLKKSDFRKLKKLQGKKAKSERQLTRLNIHHGRKFSIAKEADNEKLKTDIPFGIVLDVVSLSLSNIDVLQKRGFYKNKIDYRNESFYANLTVKNKRDKLKLSLDNLSTEIIKKITPYVAHYDVIKEFLRDNKATSGKDILIQLIDKNKKEAELFLKRNAKDEEWLKTLKDSDNPNETLNKAINDLIVNNKALFNLSNLIKKIDKQNNDLYNRYSAIKAEEIKSLLKELKSSPEIFAIADKINYSKIDTLSIKITIIEGDSLRKDIANKTQELNSKIRNFEDISNSVSLNASFETLLAQIKKYNNDNPEKIIDTTVYNNKINFINEKLNTYTHFIDMLKKERNRFNEVLKNTEITNDNNYFIVYTQSKKFNSTYLDSELNEILDLIINPKELKKNNLDAATIRKVSIYFPEIFKKIKDVMISQNIKLQHIHELEDFATAKIIELKIIDESNRTTYEKISKGINNIIPLLKMKVIFDAKGLGKYNEELLTLFEFISNLNNLDKAETYQSIVNMLRDGSKIVQENLPEGEFKDSYTVFINAMKKYTLINPNAEKEYVEVDVISFLNDLQQYYNRNSKSKFNLYLTLGLNQNFFVKNFTLPDSEPLESLNNISFASEKIGVKYRIHNFKNLNGYENVIKDDVYLNKKAPFINEFYGIMYGSGLLYTVANTTTNKNFNFPHLGFGLGIRFYNALDVNLTVGLPFVKGYNFGDNAFYGFGIDIPLGEYLEKMGNK